MKFLALVWITLRESMAKRTFITFFIISTLTALLLLLLVNISSLNSVVMSIQISGDQSLSPLNMQSIVYGVQGVLIGLLFTAGLFMSLFATSGLVPSMMRTGFIDLFITKPISRWQILLGRFIGASVIVMFNIFYLMLSIWIILSLKTGIWNVSFLFSGIIIVAMFAILYAFMTLIAVVNQNGPLSLMLTYLLFFLTPILARKQYAAMLGISKSSQLILNTLYTIFPKPSEIGQIAQDVTRNLPVQSWAPLWTSVLFGAVCFVIALVVFQRKDF